MREPSRQAPPPQTLHLQLLTRENCRQHLPTNVRNYPRCISPTLANALIKESARFQLANLQNAFALVGARLRDIALCVLAKTSQSTNNEKSLRSGCGVADTKPGSDTQLMSV